MTDTRSLQLAITTTDFICALDITNNCLHSLQALTTNLQVESKDIVATVQEINNILSTLQNTRECHDSSYTLVQYGRKYVH